MAAGLHVGEDELGWLQFSDARLAQPAAVVALALVLIEGGPTPSSRGKRTARPPASVLATARTVATAIVVAVAGRKTFGIATLPLTEGSRDGQLVFDVCSPVVLSSLTLQGTTLRCTARAL